MGETEEAKEEQTKQDTAAEPLLIILSPPPTFLPAPGQPTMTWHKWLKAFENYIEQVGESKLADSTKCLLLQNCLGQEGQRIFTTLMPDETSYAAAISTLTVYFTSDQTSQMHRLNFHQRAQRDGETAVQFMCALDELLKTCNYQEHHDQLILKQLAEKTNIPRLRERLRSENEPLTLPKALQICEEVQSLAKCDSFVHEVNVYIGDDVEPPVRRKRGRPRRGETRDTLSPSVNKLTRRTSFRCKDDYYYGSDKRYYSDDVDSGAENRSNQQHDIASQKGIKTEAFSPKDPENRASDTDYLSSPELKGTFCPICVNREFRGVNKLLRHMRTHTHEKPFNCPICDLPFSQTYHMTRHMRKQHGAGQHVCPLCGITLSSSMELQNHKKTHPAQAVPCPFCKETCPNPRAFADHIKSHSKEQLRQADLRQSGEVSESIKPLVRRAKRGRLRRGDTKQPNSTKMATNSRIEDDDVNPQGDAAGFDIGTAEENSDPNFLYNTSQQLDIDKEYPEGALSELKTEESYDGNEYLIQTDLKSPHCPICINKKFRNLNKLLRHMQTHTQQKPYSCNLCDMTFSQGYHMMRHMRNQHGAGQFVCPTCGMDLGSNAELQSHKATHPPQAVPCPYCDKISSNYHKFLGHIKFHSKLSQSEEQTDELDKKVSDESDYTSEEVESLGHCEVLDQSFSMDVAGGDTEPPVQKGETVAPPIQKAKRGRLRRGESRVRTQQSLTNTQGKTSRLKDYYCGNDQLYYDSDGTEGDGDRSESNSENSTQGKPSMVKAKGHFCPLCKGRRFRGADKLARHMRMHTKEKPFVCPVCEKAFSQSYHMTRHQRMQHGQGQYICSQCGQTIQTWTEFKAHKSLHIPGPLSCPFCEKQFKYNSAYLGHIKIHNKVPGGPKGYTCSDCGRVFKRRYHLKRHIAGHRKATNGEYYTCTTCEKIFAFSEDLKRHMDKHEKESMGICSWCNKDFSGPEELEAHMEETHMRTYSCKICSKKFKLEHALKKHEEGHVNGQYYCAQCCKYFQKHCHYKRHMLVHRRRESRCPHCNTVFLKMNAFKYHLRTHTTERPYQCTCCIESFEDKEDFNQHCLKHKKLKKERPYSCTRCDWAFSTLTELSEHMNTHEGEHPVNCPICGRTFLNKNKLEKHMSIHTGERPHLCSICGNGFPSAASLKLHINIHTGVKPFHCSQCAKSFSTGSSLRLHSRQHMEVRPSFECPECGRTYGRMTELKMHQRYHTGDKPYACTCCNKRFISRDKLNVHMRIHTGERPYSCPHCGQTFSQAGDRNRHMKKYH